MFKSKSSSVISTFSTPTSITPKIKGAKSVSGIPDKSTRAKFILFFTFLLFQSGGYEQQTRDAVLNESGTVSLYLGELITLRD